MAKTRIESKFYVHVVPFSDGTLPVKLKAVTFFQNEQPVVESIFAEQLHQYVKDATTSLGLVDLRLIILPTTAEYMRQLLLDPEIGTVEVVSPYLLTAAEQTAATGAELLKLRNLQRPASLGGWRPLKGMTKQLLLDWWSDTVSFEKNCPLVRDYRALSPHGTISVLLTFMRRVLDPRWFADYGDVCGLMGLQNYFGVRIDQQGSYAGSCLQRGDSLLDLYMKSLPRDVPDLHKRETLLFRRPNLAGRINRACVISRLIAFLSSRWLAVECETGVVANKAKDFSIDRAIFTPAEFATYSANRAISGS